MSAWLFLFLVFSCLRTTLSFDEALGSVIEVDATNAYHFLDSSKSFLLEFYAPWCGHCNNFAPHYTNIAKSLNEGSGKYRVGKCDITQNAAMAGRFDVREIPSLFLYKNGKLYKYGGSMNEQGVKTWAESGYKTKSAEQIWTSPMGPIGRAKGYLIHLGMIIVDFTPKLSTFLGVPQYVSVILVALGISSIIIGVTFVGVFINITHLKQD